MSVDKIEPGSDGGWLFPHPVSLWDHLRIAMVREFPLFEDTGKSPGRCIQLGPGWKFISDEWRNIDYPEWDAEKDPIPAKDNSVSGIVTYHTLDHVSDPRKVLADAGRVLVDGGWFVCIVPHYLGELAHSCFDHKSQFAVASWANVLGGNKYDPTQKDDMPFRLGFNMIMGLSESNLVLVTQMIRHPRAEWGEPGSGGR